MDSISAADIGQYWLKLQAMGVPECDIGRMLRRFATTFADLIAGEKGEVFLGVFLQDREEEANDGSVEN